MTSKAHRVPGRNYFSSLSRAVRLSEQRWPKDTVPLVSVICSTYNHKSYIRECLEGFLMQETTFPVEIWIRDDASTDGTTDILREYETCYPSLIFVVYEKENQYAKGVRPMPVLMERATGNYLALCEGDDYWTREDKLELQVDFFRKNPQASLVFTDRNVLGTEGYRLKHYRGSVFSKDDVFSGLVAFTQTVMVRNYSDLSVFLNTHKGFHGDVLISYYCSLRGQLHRIPVSTACYRQTGSGVWSSKSKLQRAEENITSWCRFHRQFAGGSSPILASLIAPRAAHLMIVSKSIDRFLYWGRFYLNETRGGVICLVFGFLRLGVSAFLSRLRGMKRF